MDLLVGAGLVNRTESGTGNLERYGATLRWRRAIEEGELEVADYSHLGMASRFLAGALGVPFMPSKSLLGTDILNKRRAGDDRPFELLDNPWNPGEPVVLLPACRPGPICCCWRRSWRSPCRSRRSPARPLCAKHWRDSMTI